MLYSQWLETSLATRNHIATIFGISKRGATHVENDRVVSDGFLIKDIESVLTKGALQSYLISNEEDTGKLFAMLVDSIEHPPIANPVIPPEVVPQIQEVIRKKRKYTRRAKK